MTEHFTREEAFAVADASGMLDCKLADFETTLQAFASATVDAIDKKREAQGAVAYAYAYDIFTEPACAPMASWQPVIDRDLRTDKPTRNIVPLYSHALPAQPAEPANAELVDWVKDAQEWGNALNSAGWEFNDAVKRHTGVATTAILFNSGKPIIRDVILHYAEQVQKNADLSRAQAAPAVGVPDGYTSIGSVIGYDPMTGIAQVACKFIGNGLMPVDLDTELFASAQPQQKEV